MCILFSEFFSIVVYHLLCTSLTLVLSLSGDKDNKDKKGDWSCQQVIQATLTVVIYEDAKKLLITLL